jgi:hypothetical protein
MKFSGHETFTIREGWLRKGMALVRSNPELFSDVIACSDELGVGTAMTKSIRHWLQVTGLAETGAPKTAVLQPTALGEAVWKHDSYFTDIGTWWILHVNLIRNKDQASTWYWFFNQFAQQRFDRALCNAQLQHHLTYAMKRPPSPNTLSRDIGCLLASYARTIPEPQTDPEDYTECPMAELGLAQHYRLSGMYALNFGPKDIPAEILAYCLSEEFGRHGESGITIHEAATAVRGPGRAFLMTAEALFDVAMKIDSEHSGHVVSIGGLGGERTIKFEPRPSLDWIRQYYTDRNNAASAQSQDWAEAV